jgi:hypothetical protein
MASSGHLVVESQERTRSHHSVTAQAGSRTTTIKRTIATFYAIETRPAPEARAIPGILAMITYAGPQKWTIPGAGARATHPVIPT